VISTSPGSDKPKKLKGARLVYKPVSGLRPSDSESALVSPTRTLHLRR
jgi:hypothetical protein